MKLLNLLPHEDIGWKDIGETFIRYTLLKTPWFRVYIHYLDCPDIPPHCHDHPWSFVSLILKNGYVEYHNGVWVGRKPWNILVRPAEWSHSVFTVRPAWSLVVTGPKKRPWSQHECRGKD